MAYGKGVESSMNSFFRTCVVICFIMLAFSLVANFIDSTGAFGSHTGGNPGVSVSSGDSALRTITNLEDPNMQSLWLGVTGLSLIGAIALAYVSHSLTPIGLHLFGAVFWTSWIRMSSIFSYGGYIPGDFILIFTVGVMFLFIAAIIGMLTGSG